MLHIFDQGVEGVSSEGGRDVLVSAEELLAERRKLAE